jgi:hypothetical protein
MAYAAVIVSVLALAFTILSFWWLHARKGSLTAAPPRTYAFIDKVRRRVPLAFFNTGARALIVTDLQLLIGGERSGEPLRWITTRSKLRPESDDDFAFATPFSIQRRATREVVAEFGHDLGWSPDPASGHRVRLQGKVHPSNEWRDVAEFEWWAPPSADAMSRYLAHRNEPLDPPEDAQSASRALDD